METFDEMRRQDKGNVNRMEDEEKIIENMMKLSLQDLNLLKRFVGGNKQAFFGIIEKLLLMEKKYRMK